MELCSLNIYLLIYLSLSHVLCSVYERLSYLVAFCFLFERKITNMRLCIYMVIAHKTIKSSLTKKTDFKTLVLYSFVKVYKDL